MQELKPIIPPPPQRRDMNLTQNRLPSTSKLDGTSLELAVDGGATLEASFADGKVTYSGTRDDGTAFAGMTAYDAVEMRPGVFFLDWADVDRMHCFTNVVDTTLGRALCMWIVIRGSGTGAKMTEMVGSARIVGSDMPYEPIGRTRELFGKRLVCKYSDEAALEHIYANSGVVVWQWMISPPEMGLQREVGTESVFLFKIQDNLYQLTSRADAPIGLLLLLDLDRKRNVGRLFGYGETAGIVEHRCGAEITLLGEFTYPAEFQPG